MSSTSSPASYSAPNAVRSSSAGTVAKTASAHAATAPMTPSPRASTVRGSAPAAARRVASGTTQKPSPIAIQTTALAATTVAA